MKFDKSTSSNNHFKDYFEEKIIPLTKEGLKSFRFITRRINVIDMNASLLSNFCIHDYNIIYVNFLLPWLLQKDLIMKNSHFSVPSVRRLSNINIIDCMIPDNIDVAGYSEISRLEKPYSLSECLRKIPEVMKKIYNESFVENIGKNNARPWEVHENKIILIIDDIFNIMYMYNKATILRFLRYLKVFSDKYSELHIIINQGLGGKKVLLPEVKEIVDFEHIFRH